MRSLLRLLSLCGLALIAAGCESSEAKQGQPDLTRPSDGASGGNDGGGPEDLPTIDLMPNDLTSDDAPDLLVASDLSPTPDLLPAGYLDAPVAGDAFVSPTGTDTANDCQTEANPCKTIAFAATQAAPGHTLWLLSATFTTTDQTSAANVVDGIRVRARTLGEAIVQVRITLLGSHRVEGLVFDGGASAAGAPGLDMSTGTITLVGVAFAGYLITPLRLSGTAKVTLQPGGLADYNYNLAPQVDSSGYSPLFEIKDTAELLVEGGTFGGPGVGYGAALPTLYGAAFAVRNAGKLTMNGVTIKVRTRGIVATDTATVKLVGCTIQAVAMTSAGYGVWVAGGSSVNATVEITDSTIMGFAYGGNSAGIASPEYENASTSSFTVTNTSLTGNSLGIYTGPVSSSDFTLHGVTISGSLFGGIKGDGSCNLDIEGGSISGNAIYTPTPFGYYGGVHLGATNKRYTVKLRGVSVQNNKNTTVDGNTNSAENSGLTLGGDALSTFDLGTLADPGLNVITGNDTGSATTNLRVKVNAGVTVSAVGNTFVASTQGASAAGAYVLGATPCGSTTCDLTTGSGVNYLVASGTLRLAE